MSWGNAAIVFGAWWYKDALLKFIVITLGVMIICYVIVISTNMPEKHWPPVFMGGILGVGLLYVIPTLSMPSFSFGKKSDGDFVAPEVDYSSNPWRNGSISDDSGWGGKRRVRRSK